MSMAASVDGQACGATPGAPGSVAISAARLVPALIEKRLGLIKTGVALAGTALLLWGWLLRLAGRRHGFQRLRDVLLLGLGLLAALCWWNLLRFHYDHYVHRWDTYHYCLGAKYFPELGYTRLYLCTVVADAEDGLASVGGNRKVRDLETNRLVGMQAILSDATRCTTHFSPDRWAAFKHDLTWFRSEIGSVRWPKAQRDHGYNATPMWTVLGRTLASTGPASSAQIRLLALLDPLLLVAMWVTAWWAFGWRSTCVALLFWGTNYPAYFGWTGGAYLRQDWLALSVIGLALLRRGWMGGAGFALASADLLRVFPWLIVVGIIGNVASEMWGRRTIALPVEYRRFGTGSVLAVTLFVPAATLLTGGWGVWPAFLANSIKHSSTAATNYMGLKTIMAYDHDSLLERMAVLGLEDDAVEVWRLARHRVFSERRSIFAGLVLGFLVALSFAVRGQPAWVAGVLGMGLVPVVTEISCYYYSILLVFGFLWPSRESIGVTLCGLSPVTWLIAALVGSEDEVFTAISVAVVGFAGLALVAVAIGAPCEGEDHTAAPVQLRRQ